jgi:NAD(P)-dependent dehydrogenase (short-subunit alcohol dehydrogenase family)
MLNALPDGIHALVTGASRGIGLEFVRQLLATPRVARVFAACRQPAEATALSGLAAGEPRLQIVALDVADEAQVEAAARQVAIETDRLHLIVNAAGVLHDAAAGLAPEKRLADVGAGALAASFAVNAFGPLLVAKHFERLLAHRERTVFASISARVGSIGDNRLGGWTSYRASKATLNMVLKNMVGEILGPYLKPTSYLTL